MGFHRLESLWRIEYKLTTMEPFITQPATEEAKEAVGEIIGKELAKAELDAVPLVIGGCAVITGNSIKGLFRHIVSAQLTAAGIDVCIQGVKLGERSKLPDGRKPQCSPDNPCFACRWFGTASRQGALYFGMLKSVKPIGEILVDEPIPMIAVNDEYKAIARRAFLLIAPVKSGVEFRGVITGENLSEEIIGAIGEIQDMSRRGFVKIGGFKTRGMGAVKIEIEKIENYRATPFELDKTYTGEELKSFLDECRRKYREMLSNQKE